MTLEVTDADGASATDALGVDVSAGTPLLGSYPDAATAAGGSTTATPSAPPSDDGTFTLSVASPTFTGTLSVDQTTGVVSIGNANTGTHTVTVTATDDCAAESTRAFTLTVGSPSNATTTPGGPLGTAPLVNGAASFTHAFTTVENVALTIAYSGDAGFLAGSTSYAQKVGRPTTTALVSSPAGSSTAGQKVTFTATVSCPTCPSAPYGRILFIDGARQIGSAYTVGGVASFSTTRLRTKTHSMKAIFSPIGLFGPSTSAPMTFTVNP